MRHAPGVARLLLHTGLHQQIAADQEDQPARRIARAAAPHHPSAARHMGFQIAQERSLRRLHQLYGAQQQQDGRPDEQKRPAARPFKRGFGTFARAVTGQGGTAHQLDRLPRQEQVHDPADPGACAFGQPLPVGAMPFDVERGIRDPPDTIGDQSGRHDAQEELPAAPAQILQCAAGVLGAAGAQDERGDDDVEQSARREADPRQIGQARVGVHVISLIWRTQPRGGRSVPRLERTGDYLLSSSGGWVRYRHGRSRHVDNIRRHPRAATGPHRAGD